MSFLQGILTGGRRTGSRRTNRMIFLLTTISEMLYWRLRFYVYICQHVAMDSIGRIGQMELWKRTSTHSLPFHRSATIPFMGEATHV